MEAIRLVTRFYVILSFHCSTVLSGFGARPFWRVGNILYTGSKWQETGPDKPNKRLDGAVKASIAASRQKRLCAAANFVSQQADPFLHT